MTNPKAPRKETEFAFFSRQIKKSNRQINSSNRLGKGLKFAYSRRQQKKLSRSLLDISDCLIFFGNTLECVKFNYLRGDLILAWAAANLAIGTLNGEQET